MVSTFTTRKRLEKQNPGENSNTWGGYLNTNALDLIDECFGVVCVAMTTAGDSILSTQNGATDQGRRSQIILTGAPTSNVSLFTPAVQSFYLVRNKMTGANKVTLKNNGGTVGVDFSGSGSGAEQGLVVSDGTNVREVLRTTSAGSIIALTSTVGGGASVVPVSGVLEQAQPVNAQTGVNYTYLLTDRGKIVTRTNAAAMADTLPQATANFGAGWFTTIENISTSARLTITPTTSTIDGAATLIIYPGQVVTITSDGTNYQATITGNNLVRYAAKTANYTLLPSDFNAFIDFTTAGFTLSTAIAAANFSGIFFVRNSATTGNVTWDPTSTETTDGLTTITIFPGETYCIASNGTNWVVVHKTSPFALFPKGYINGLETSRISTTSFAVAAGAASSENASARGWDITLTASITKTTSNFATGTGNGGLDTGAIGSNTWYHVHLIRRDSDGLADVLFSTSVSSPTMPSGYTARRRIGSIKTDGSSQFVLWTQFGDEFLWDVALIDFDVLNPGNTAVSRTLTVPTGLKVLAIIDGGAYSGGAAGTSMNFSSLDSSDQASQSGATAALTGIISQSTQNLGAPNANWQFTRHNIRTNTSAQIRTRCNFAATSNERMGIITRGWIDSRGK